MAGIVPKKKKMEMVKEKHYSGFFKLWKGRVPFGGHSWLL